MRVLIACEESQEVCKAFRALGHEAYSADVQKCSGGHPEWHLEGDVLNVLDDGWDLMIAHPPCQYLCSSGLHWNKRVEGRQEKTEAALEFVRKFMDCNIPRIAIENPIGCISTRIRKYDQKIQPWQFGDDASKGTCLWLKNLPPLIHTNIIPPQGWKRHVDPKKEDGSTYKIVDGVTFVTDLDPAPKKLIWGNQTPSGQNKLGPSPERSKLRSKTYKGIAEAFAQQWGIF